MPGWGGRDRTSEWRNQNPLPYRLATPHRRRGNSAFQRKGESSLRRNGGLSCADAGSDRDFKEFPTSARRHDGLLRFSQQVLVAAPQRRYKTAASRFGAKISRAFSDRSVAQPGSAPASGAGGRRFESSHSDHSFSHLKSAAQGASSATADPGALLGGQPDFPSVEACPF